VREAGAPAKGKRTERFAAPPARARAEEVIGGGPNRAKAKRGKACTTGRPAASGRTRNLLESYV